MMEGFRLLSGVVVVMAVCLCMVESSEEKSSLKLSAFNIRVFGVSKSRKVKAMHILSKIVRRYDITFVQEIRDKRQTVIYKFLDQVNRDADGDGVYDVIVSERLGRTRSKEQYAYIFRKDVVELSNPHLYDDAGDDFEREPYSILVRSLLIEVPPFFLLGIHVDPDVVKKELNCVDDAFAEAAEFYGTTSGIIVGDLNADCKYLSLARSKELDMTAVKGFTWMIGRKEDTTTKASTHCAYDRFIVFGEISSYIVPGSAHAFRYDLEYGLTERQALKVSDHYPIECLIQGAASTSGKFFD